MDPARTEIYEGREVDVYVLADVGRQGFIGMYEIRQGGRKRTCAVIAGGFVISQQAAEAALDQAKRWIDQEKIAAP